jgi:hypothetical protein
MNSVRPLLAGEPSIEYYNVDASTAHRIPAEEAA